jgi:Domain of unknown function (DUF4150)/GHH signature containing HNH/Endo VII superfamily nuclease toxin  2
MANEVYANMMEVSCKAGSGKATCAFPDVCFTPPPAPAPGIPIPYPNTGVDADTAEGTRTVQISGQEAMIKNKSYFSKSSGDEAGKAPKKGEITGTNTGKVYFNAWSMNVMFEGENVVRNLDQTTHNHASFPGNAPPWLYLSKSSVANPNGVCADEVNNVNTKCSGVADPCAGLGTEKPARLASSPEANDLADKTAANDCLAARRCALQTYIPNTCCPPQTGHHLIEASALFDKGRGGKGSTPLMGIANYNENDAPCVCAEGVTQFTGTHALMHTFQSVEAATCPIGDLPLSPRGMLKGVKWTTYRKAKESGFKAMQKVFPDSKCSQACIEAQLDNYHRQCGVKNHTKIKAVKTGRTDVTVAEKAIADRDVRVQAARAGGGSSGMGI